MYSHVTIGSNDLERAIKFYNALLTPLGLRRREVIPDVGSPAACWIMPDKPLPKFWVFQPLNGEPATIGNGGMVAFLAPNQKAVHTAYAAGLEMGGSDEGPPGPRDRYAVGYYGAYLRDPDGNKIHIAYRGDLA